MKRPAALLAGLACALLAWGAPQAGPAPGGETKVAAAVGQRGEAWVVDVQANVPVTLETAWSVLTDFERMPAFLGNLSASRIVRQEGNSLLIRQEGKTRFGLIAIPFASEREVRLEPMRRILSRQTAGTLKRMESEARLEAGESGVLVNYHAEIVPDSVFAQMFGAELARREIEEQFQAMAREMRRRQGN